MARKPPAVRRSADTFPSALTDVTWTCSASGGASCAASGSGNINDLGRSAGGWIRHVHCICNRGSGCARNSISNTATITAPVGIIDPILSNNSATDTDSIITGGTACESDATLVGCWQMEENGGTVLIDGSSYFNDGALNGAPAWAAGKVGSYALDLDGTTQYAVVADDATLDITNQITLSAWIKPEQYATQDLIKKATKDSIDGYELTLATTKTDASSQRVFFRINDASNGDTYRINATTEYPIDGTWMHAAATYDGTTMRLYINGVLESSLTLPAGTTDRHQ